MLSTRGPCRILIVDDEIAIRSLLQDYFLQLGYEVMTAASAGEATQILSSEQIGVALVDLKLPDHDGLYVIDRLKQASPEAAVVMMTGYPTMDSVLGALQHGAFYFIVKPFRLSELEETIQRAWQISLKNRRLPALEARVALLEDLLFQHGIDVSEGRADAPGSPRPQGQITPFP